MSVVIKHFLSPSLSTILLDGFSTPRKLLVGIVGNVFVATRYSFHFAVSASLIILGVSPMLNITLQLAI
jgi:hypothetical protein